MVLVCGYPSMARYQILLKFENSRNSCFRTCFLTPFICFFLTLIVCTVCKASTSRQNKTIKRHRNSQEFLRIHSVPNEMLRRYKTLSKDAHQPGRKNGCAPMQGRYTYPDVNGILGYGYRSNNNNTSMAQRVGMYPGTSLRKLIISSKLAWVPGWRVGRLPLLLFVLVRDRYRYPGIPVTVLQCYYYFRQLPSQSL